jgi:hypothetical protein
MTVADLFFNVLVVPYERVVNPSAQTRIRLVRSILAGWAAMRFYLPLNVVEHDGIKRIDCGDQPKFAWTELSATILAREMKGSWSVGKLFYDNDSC